MVVYGIVDGWTRLELTGGSKVVTGHVIYPYPLPPSTDVIPFAFIGMVGLEMVLSSW